MPNLYIIAGANGAGKTTASFTVLPEMLNCDEFINADEIARGLAPLNPGKAAIEAGRLVIKRKNQLISEGKDFGLETTLATKAYVRTIEKAEKAGYMITLLYFWLDSPKLAVERVKARVAEGGHGVPEHIVVRRYYSGLRNLFNLYIPVCKYWMIFDNSRVRSELIAEGYMEKVMDIKNIRIFDRIKNTAKYGKKS